MKSTKPLEKNISPKEFKQINRRSFFIAGIAGLLGIGGIFGIANAGKDRQMPWPLRRANSALASLWNKFFNQNARLPSVDADGKPIRMNGDIGLLAEVNPISYRLSVTDLLSNTSIELTLQQIKEMPVASESFEFKCIEGWSRPVSCKGVRFSDFLRILNVGQEARFAGMRTIDGNYFVSWDRKSLLHSQTLLCYEMNGSPLSPENGAPLRILSSVKYGVKQIKQIGSIEFMDNLPRDYWAERGYDDYLGL